MISITRLPLKKASRGMQMTLHLYGFFVHIRLSHTPNLGCSLGALSTLERMISCLYAPHINCTRFIPLSTLERSVKPSFDAWMASMSSLSLMILSESLCDSVSIWSASDSSTHSSVCSNSRLDLRLAAERSC